MHDEPYWTISRWQYVELRAIFFPCLSAKVSGGPGQNYPMKEQPYDRGWDAPYLGIMWSIPLADNYLLAELFKQG
jgi:hypothetical protein